MNKFRLAFCAVLFASLTLALASLAEAQAVRTWVSGVGDDINPCSRTAPCKTFAGAISKTLMNGEINALDSGGFGAVIITKSITIDGSGALSGVIIPGAGATAITINITAAADAAKSVRLRGLTINGALNGSTGVKILAATKVVIEDCVISNFTQVGISLAVGTVYVRNTTISNNKNGINATGGLIALNDTSIVFNAVGLVGDSNIIVRYNNVVLFGNTTGDPPLPRNP